MTQDGDEPTVVQLSFPPQPRLVRMARLASSALATIAGADIETIDDVKIAVDEVCAALIEVSDGSAVELTFELVGSRLGVIGRTATGAPLDLDPDRFALSRQILRAVADDHELAAVDGGLRVSLSCLVGVPADGA